MADSEVSHRFHMVENTRIHFVTAGNVKNQALILIAGFPESWYAWRKVIPFLSKSYWVIAPDLPGQGDSDKPAIGYDTQTLAVTLHGLLEGLGLSRYFMAAHDVGAWVAFPYAIMFKEEVERIALLDAGIPGVTLPSQLPTNPDHAWRTWHFMFHGIPDLPESLLEGKERIYLEWFLLRKAANPLVFTVADIDMYVKNFTRPGALRAGLAYYRSSAKSADQNQTLLKSGSLQVPILAISSDQGSIPDMAAPLRTFASHVEGATIKECGHYIPEEQPGALARELSNFFVIGRC
ncbi:hypothetical protein HG535_0C00110 [Zygotorulaspora mrakii]|uniref:AB hydrolase-1 domain-containing protein n=1 Tax=Zygotorulaspora mrakii TaxID=42260 RepID=A0A7H9AZZ8_ZYGMR|nr:uncharacterized protein HG535_0A09210 [Zygotorulaspora mrakii]XP_037143392.1 uncharacterized protein HG535_0C00110 [Zygotorulaspora mrakii]QLG70970.1 hypothetical protein HG535_0A09210 [Zygotorulaspora mrakii]QLG71664.1 hypothetical protein HG535_0C00110 [Zygotorulaspora mrakii]